MKWLNFQIIYILRKVTNLLNEACFQSYIEYKDFEKRACFTITNQSYKLFELCSYIRNVLKKSATQNSI